MPEKRDWISSVMEVRREVRAVEMAIFVVCCGGFSGWVRVCVCGWFDLVMVVDNDGVVVF